MKKILFILLFSPVLSFAQEVDTVKVKSHDVYCIMNVAPKLTGSKVEVSVDFGQETKLFVQRLKDENGNKIEFNSIVGALNYMARKGWMFANSYVLGAPGTSTVYYVMRRKIID
ncbi:MAG: hypothetical protein ABIN91_24200 [Mucilaginibacter sp.]|uniref:hypothetical protein n=1 Tax=Mucilaginibacter sp. TaxID=1882438 RepID=UPI00326361B1